MDKTKRKIYFNKTTAIVWIIAGIAAFIFGWQDAVWFVVVASVYANVKADWSTAEAADDREVKALLQEIKEQNNGYHCPSTCDCRTSVFRSGSSAGSYQVQFGSAWPTSGMAGGSTEPDGV